MAGDAVWAEAWAPLAGGSGATGSPPFPEGSIADGCGNSDTGIGLQGFSGLPAALKNG